MRSDGGLLHLVGSAAALPEALALLGDGDALVLLEDAAPLALAGAATGRALDGVPGVHVVVADLAARGLAGRALRANVAPVDYRALVDLACIQRASVSWW